VPYTVIGVVGPDFNTELDTPPDLWLPFQIDPNSMDQARYFSILARLKPGVTVGMANARLITAADEFRSKFPGFIGPRGTALKSKAIRRRLSLASVPRS
jgi:hypothetical protein